MYHSPEMCAGRIPTEIRRLTAMQDIHLHDNGLSGAPLIANIWRLVNEFITCAFVFCGMCTAAAETAEFESFMNNAAPYCGVHIPSFDCSW